MVIAETTFLELYFDFMVTTSSQAPVNTTPGKVGQRIILPSMSSQNVPSLLIYLVSNLLVLKPKHLIFVSFGYKTKTTISLEGSEPESKDLTP